MNMNMIDGNNLFVINTIQRFSTEHITQNFIFK